ncbi:MAG: hypothetical protein K0S47_304 [Herbinix sp.]|jgi:acyl carrier protein|nr:hypothetical protein [Herbinix sp.]
MSDTRDKVLEIIKKINHMEIRSDEVNLFSTSVNISPLDMVYILQEIKAEFGLEITNEFVEAISNTTVKNIVNYIEQCTTA